MILLYTGAPSNGGAQINADKSLGGYISSSPVPNGRLDNIFSLVSKSIVLGKKSEIRMIALKNTTGAPVTNVKIYSNVLGSSVKLKLAAVAPYLNESNVPVFESVQDGYSLPYQATLDYYLDADDAIEIPSISANETIGIWILREINTASFPELLPGSQLSTNQLATLLESVQPVREESVELVINY